MVASDQIWIPESHGDTSPRDEKEDKQDAEGENPLSIVSPRGGKESEPPQPQAHEPPLVFSRRGARKASIDLGMQHVMDLISRSRTHDTPSTGETWSDNPIDIQLMEKLDILPRRTESEGSDSVTDAAGMIPGPDSLSSEIPEVPQTGEVEEPWPEPAEGSLGRTPSFRSAADVSVVDSTPEISEEVPVKRTVSLAEKTEQRPVHKARMGMIASSSQARAFSRTVHSFSSLVHEEPEGPGLRNRMHGSTRSNVGGEDGDTFRIARAIGKGAENHNGKYVSQAHNIYGKHISVTPEIDMEGENAESKNTKSLWKAAAWYQSLNDGSKSPRSRQWRRRASAYSAHGTGSDEGSPRHSPTRRLQSPMQSFTSLRGTGSLDAFSRASSRKSSICSNKAENQETLANQRCMLGGTEHRRCLKSTACWWGHVVTVVCAVNLLYFPSVSALLPWLGHGPLVLKGVLVASLLILACDHIAMHRNGILPELRQPLTNVRVTQIVLVLFVGEQAFLSELHPAHSTDYNWNQRAIGLQVYDTLRQIATMYLLCDGYIRYLAHVARSEEDEQSEQAEGEEKLEGEGFAHQLLLSCRSAFHSVIVVLSVLQISLKVVMQFCIFFYYSSYVQWAEELVSLSIAGRAPGVLPQELVDFFCKEFSRGFNPLVSLTSGPIAVHEQCQGNIPHVLAEHKVQLANSVVLGLDLHWHVPFVAVADLLVITTTLAVALACITQVFFQVRNKVTKPTKRMIQTVIDICRDPFKPEEDKPVPSCAETAHVEDTVLQLAGLLRHGFGEAGTDIIGNSMQEGRLDLKSSGIVVQAFFGFCDIRNFTDLTESLQPDVVKVVNLVAEHLHASVAENYGAPNKNVGDAFLLVWKPKWDLSIQTVADSTLRSYLRVIVEMDVSRKLQRWASKHEIQSKIPNFRIEMGYGLHHGWSIECAIGSERKVDISYLSHHVNLASRLEAATKQYRTTLLISEDVVCLLSRRVRKLCRPVDRVTFKGSATPITIYTYDVPRGPSLDLFIDTDKVSSTRTELSEFFNLVAPTVDENDRAMVRKAIGHYTGCGDDLLDWPRATQLMKAFVERYPNDGPVSTVVDFMNRNADADGEAPSWWQGFRPLDQK